VGSSPTGGGGAEASMAAPWCPALAMWPGGSGERNLKGFSTMGQCEVGNSPRMVLGGEGGRKIARDGETSAWNSVNEASLLLGSSSFVSLLWWGHGSLLLSVEPVGLRRVYSDAAMVMAREKAVAQFLRPKMIVGRGLYRGILWCVDRGLLQPTLPRIQARFNSFGFDSVRDKTDLVFGLNSTARGGV
jgi:hypothetical protein